MFLKPNNYISVSFLSYFITVNLIVLKLHHREEAHYKYYDIRIHFIRSSEWYFNIICLILLSTYTVYIMGHTINGFCSISMYSSYYYLVSPHFTSVNTETLFKINHVKQITIANDCLPYAEYLFF